MGLPSARPVIVANWPAREPNVGTGKLFPRAGLKPFTTGSPRTLNARKSFRPLFRRMHPDGLESATQIARTGSVEAQSGHRHSCNGRER